MFRVDPSALPDGEGQRDYYTNTPMEIAVIWDRPDMLKILTEFTDIPDKVKLLQLSKLMGSSDNVEKSKEEFQRILCSIPADLVSSFFYTS